MSDTWVSISEAPKDGRPVWARGLNGGSVLNGYHYALVYWHDCPHIPVVGWWTAAPTMEHMEHLVDYMPDAFTREAPRIILQ